ncbi:EF-hand domain-containing protein 1 isoform X1 [Conger conger]|uniref:EF-hand domain-containing protein 1 isoform X1 n=1 Tax=Conger conger TaxID=82655 RepID=UPI002A59D21B|nr:EF-hand domain-containing protein 1 isoform X1 [Conger conger]
MTDYSGHGLPFLPGNTFRDITKSAQHRSQTLTYKNGYILPKRPIVGIGQADLFSDHLNQSKVNQLVIQNLAQTHEQLPAGPSTEFIPAHVFFDKKVLRFFGYFKQVILLSPQEQYRVRPVIISYFLEDDSFCVIEPEVENSGMPQGKLIKRQRLPKNKQGDFYHWKDLNVGIDICVFGVAYRITSCDQCTKAFLESEGILLNEPEEIPTDPYTQRRTQPQQAFVTPSDFDCLKQFLFMDRKVLRFFALWEHSDSVHMETRPVTIHYYLGDNSVEIRETHEHNSGRDPYPVLLRRQKVPKDVKPKTEPFPSCVLEVSPQEVQDYFSPKDFCVGESVNIVGRDFLLYDCDEFTLNYYKENFRDMALKPIQVKAKPSPDIKREIPPYNGFGSLQDSLQNCKSLIPEPPKKDLLKMLEKDGKVLRYTARLDSLNPDDNGRRFILSYFLSNDTISIFETNMRNSGIIGGKFLEKTQVHKPGSTPENPQYYSPADFAIGTTVEVFGRRFVLLDADLYVLNYLESIADQIPSETINSLRQRLYPDPNKTQTTDETLETNENTL